MVYLGYSGFMVVGGLYLLYSLYFALPEPE